MFEMSGVPHRAQFASSRRNRRRPFLATGATAAALAALAQAGPGRAQVGPPVGSYLATTDNASNVNARVSVPSAGRTNIFVSGPTTNGVTSAVVNWTPTNTAPAHTAIVFQAAGTNAVFTSAGQDYIVLNNINSTALNPVRFDGVTTSYIGPEVGRTGPGTIGGTVLFYSPGGIIASSSGVFNVGSLVLSASKVQVNTLATGYGINLLDASGRLNFTGVSDPDAAVTLEAGAHVNLTRQNSFIALVAPRVTQGGIVDVNGSAAYVAAENVSLKFTNGLFDIAVNDTVDADGNTVHGGASATSDGSAVLSHTGTTTGPAATGQGLHNVYMVAVPKNQAITMLVTGNVGYRGAALDATIDNGAVVLSAGANVASQASASGYGTIANFAVPPAPAVATSIAITDATFTSGVTGFATGALTAIASASVPAVVGPPAVAAVPAGTLTFNGLATLTGATTQVGAGAGGTVLAKGDLTLTGTGTATTAGTVVVDANGGAITAQRALTLVADDAAGSGGTLRLAAEAAGTLSVTGATAMSSPPTNGVGVATGGTAEVIASGARINLQGGLDIDVSNVNPADGVASRGGTITVRATGGQIDVGYGATFNASAAGGYGATATGGTVTIDNAAGLAPPAGLTAAITLGPDVTIDAQGTGGGTNADRTAPGAGVGGTVNVTAETGSIVVPGSLIVQVEGSGAAGYSNAQSASAGARGDGGTILVRANGGDLSLGTRNFLSFDASAYGGAGGQGSTGEDSFVGNGGDGGFARGGTVTLQAIQGTIGLGDTSIYATATGGNGGFSDTAQGGVGGSALGGTVTIGATRATTAGTAGSITAGTGPLSATAGATAGTSASDAASTSAPAPTAQGGTASLTADSGASIAFAGTSLTAGAVSAPFSNGVASGLLKGGTVTVSGTTGATLSLGALSLDTDGLVGLLGAVGPTQGGTSTLSIDHATLNVGTIAISAKAGGDANSFGGGGDDFAARAVPVAAAAAAPAPGVTPDAMGGTARATFGPGSTLTIGDYGTISLSTAASGYGAAAGGGISSLTFDGVTTTLPGQISVLADADQVPGQIGDARAGDATLTITGGADVTVRGDVIVSAVGTGGSGSYSYSGDFGITSVPGAPGAGGNATVTVSGSTLTASGALLADARGIGGYSYGADAGGAGAGGAAAVSISGASTVAVDTLRLDGSGTGGSNYRAGYYGTSLAGPGGAGGNATAGSAAFTIGAGSLTVTNAARLLANATGGVSGTSGAGGDATAGSVSFATGYGGTVSTVSLGSLELSAIGIGGSHEEDDGIGGDGGRGVGGIIKGGLSGATQTLASLSIDARGVGGTGGDANSSTDAATALNGGNGGAATGGSIAFTVANALTVTAPPPPPFEVEAVPVGATPAAGAILISSGAIGGAGGSSSAGLGGNGGAANVSTLGATFATGTGNVTAAAITVDASAVGGNVGAALSPDVTGIQTGGAATAGPATFAAGGGTISVPAITIAASAVGGASGGSGYGDITGGSATAGIAALTSAGSAFVATTLTLDGSAKGADARGAGLGGDGIGGGATVALVGGSLSPTQTFTLDAHGTGGDSSTLAGSGTGGTASIASAAASTLGGQPAPAPVTIRIPTALTLDASGVAGTGGGAAAGTGGTASLAIASGTLTLTGDTVLDASGVGTAAAGGAGTGGTASVSVANNALIVAPGTILLAASGLGASGGSGGAGTGGGASVTADGGRLAVTDALTLTADGIGGGATSGTGGAGTGGIIGVTVRNGTTATPAAVTADGLTLSAAGVGGSALAGSNARDGGNGTGGAITIAVAGGNLSPAATRIGATGTGGDGYGTIAAGLAGTGRSGSIAITSAAGTLPGASPSIIAFTSLDLDVSATGAGAVGGTAYGALFPVTGGDAFGGTATIDIGNGTFTPGATTILASAIGGAGQSTLGTTGLGGAGGNAVGGAIAVGSSGGTLNFAATPTSFSAQAGATGGAGGDGGTGGAGGFARGGSLTLGASGGATPTFGAILYDVSATGGAGGIGHGIAAGAGGDATGGALNLTAAGVGSRLALAGLNVTISAQAGAGGTGDDGARGAAGGAGGKGTGGTVGITATNGGTVALADTASGYGTIFVLDGIGGNGGAGGTGTGYGDSGGDGGAGGNGVGGTLSIANSGGTIVIGTLDATANGIGGNGAAGGSGTSFAGTPDTPATPGDPTANPPIPPTPFIPGNPPIAAVTRPSGSAGTGTGGSATFALTDFTPATGGTPLAGSIATGDVTIAASGVTGSSTGFVASSTSGQFAIRNLSASGAGTINLGNVFLAADGDVAPFVGGDGAPITQGLGLDLEATGGLVHAASLDARVVGHATIAAANAGTFTFDNELIVRADDITVSHDTPATATSATINANTITLIANQADIDVTAGSLLRASSSMTLNARGNIQTTGGRLSAANEVDLIAGADIDAGDIIAGAPVTLTEIGYGDVGYGAVLSGGIVRLHAGNFTNLGEDGLNGSAVRIDGNVSSTLLSDVVAGGSVDVLDNATLGSDNLVQVRAGDDIRVAGLGTIVGARNPFQDDGAAFEDSVGNAGVSLTASPAGLGLNYAIFGNVNSIIVGGTIDAGSRAVALRAGGAFDPGTNSVRGGAIVATGPIVARSLIVGIDDAPAPGAARLDDNGQLAAGCLEGAVCLGTINTSRTLLIGGLAGTDQLPTDVQIQGSTANDQTVIRSRDTVTLGSGDGTTTTIVGRDLLRVQSSDGGIALTPGTVLQGGLATGDFGGAIQLAAATGIDGPGAIVDGAGHDVGLATGTGDLRLGTLRAGRLQTLDGDLDIVSDTALIAAGDVAIGSLTVDGADAIIRANGVGVGALDSSNAVSLTAANGSVTGSDITARNGNVALTAFDGDVTFSGTISATQDISALANGTITVGDVTSTGARDDHFGIDLNAGRDIATGNATASNAILLTSGLGSVTTGTLTAPDATIVLADRNVAVGGVATGGLFYVADTSAISGLDGARAPATVIGALGVGNAPATRGAVTLGGTIVTGTTIVTAGTDIGFGSVTATGLLQLASAGGNITGTGTGTGTGNGLATPGDIRLAAPGSIGFSTANAGGAFSANGGSFAADSIIAGGDLLIRSSGAVAAGLLQAGDDIGVIADSTAIARAITTGLGSDTGDATLLDVPAPAPGETPPGGFAFDDEAVPGAASPVDVGATRTPPALVQQTLVGTLSGANITVATNGGLGLGTGDSAGSIVLASSNGGVGSGSLTARNLIDARGLAGAIDLGSANAGSTITLFAGGGGIQHTIEDAPAGTDLTAGGDIDARASGTITLATVKTGGLFYGLTQDRFTADAITSVGDLDITAFNDIVVGDLYAHGDVNILGQANVTADEVETGGVSPDPTIPLPPGPGGDINVTALGDVTMQEAAADGNVTIDAGGLVTIARGTAGGTIDIAAGRDIALSTGEAGNGIALDAQGGVTSTALKTDTMGYGVSGDIAVTAVDAIALGSGDAAGSLTATSTAGGVTANAPLNAGGAVSVTGTGGNVTLADATAGGALAITAGAAGGPAYDISGGTLRAGTTATLSASGNAAFADGQSAGDLTVTAGRDIAVGTARSTGGAIALAAGGALTATTLTAATAITGTGATIAGGDETAATGITLTATGALGAGQLVTTGGTNEADAPLGDISVAGGTVTLAGARSAAGLGILSTAGDTTATGPLTAAGPLAISVTDGSLALADATAGTALTFGATGGIAAHMLTAGAGARVTAGQAIAIDSAAIIGNLNATAGTTLDLRTANATNSLSLTAGQTLTVPGTLTAGQAVQLRAGGALTTGAITAGAGIDARSTGGMLALGALSAAGSIALASTDVTQLADVTSTGGGIALAGDAGLTAGNLRARNAISASSNAGPVALADIESLGGSVGVTAARDIRVGNVRAAGGIFLTGGGAITGGDLTAGTGPLLDTGYGVITGGGAGGTDLAPGGIAPGFDGAAIERCDDCATDTVVLPFTINYFGNSYANTFVSNNGYLTFVSPSSTYTPSGLGTGYVGQPIIAAFFGDVDTNNPASAQVTYGPGTFAGRQAFGATYANVGYFSSRADKTNSFQIVLTNRGDTGAGNFDIYYNYTRIGWETGEADGGINGLGGTSAAVGYNAGTGNQPGTYFELPGSLVPGSFLDTGTAPLRAGTNDGVAGQLLFTVRSGQVTPGGAAQPPIVQVSNVASGNSADITLGKLSGEGVQVHGAGRVTVGDVAVTDLGSGITVAGNPFATSLDATTTLVSGDIASAGLVALGADRGDLTTGAITTPASVVALTDGTVILGQVTTGRGASDSLFISSPSILTGDPAFAGFSFDTLSSSAAFQPAALATATPVRGGGAITIAQPVSTGNLIVAASGPIGLGAVDAGNRVELDGGDVTAQTLLAGGDIAVTGGAITLGSASAGDDLALASTDAITAATLTSSGAAGSDNDGNGSRIDVTATGPVAIDRIAGAGAVALDTGGTLQVTTDLAAAGPITARGSAVALNAQAGLALADVTATTGSVAVDAVNDLSVDNARAAGSIVLASSTGAVTLGNASTELASATAPTRAALRSGRSPAAVISTSGRGDITVRAATTATLTGTVDARDDIGVTAGGLARIAGSALATRVELASADIDLASTARVGAGARTTEVAFTNNSPTNRVYLGTGGTDGYTLDTAELGTVAARTIRVLAPTALAGGDPEVTIGALALTGSAGTQTARLYGDTAGFTVETPGRIHVTGALAMGASATTDTLTLVAGGMLDVVTPTASILLAGTGTGTDGGAATTTTPGGRLVLAGDQILVTSAQAATDLAALTTTDAKDARLGQVDGTANPAGYLAADAIEFRVGRALYVQNSGVSGQLGSASRGGFTAGAGGVTITASGDTGTADEPGAGVLPTVIINGRIANADGTFVTGAGVIPRLVIRGSQTQTGASLDPRSTANGCLIVGVSCRFDMPTTGIFPVQDTINEALDPSRDADLIGDPTQGIVRAEIPLIDMPDFATYTNASSIDEPVTGTGNDDLSIPTCSDPSQPDCPRPTQ